MAGPSGPAFHRHFGDLQMKPTRLTLSQHSVRSYRHIASIEDSIEDVMKPDYFGHVARSLGVGDRVEVLSEDGSWYAELIVRAVGSVEVIMGQINHVVLSKQDAAELTAKDSPYEIKWRGPNALFSVVRVSDGEVVRDKLPSKDAASLWLKNHEKAVAA